MKKKRTFPGASAYADRHGTRRWRYRKGDFSRELGTDYGSEEFVRRYEAAVHEHRTGRKAGAGAAQTVPGSINDLVASYYRTPQWRNLVELTKKTYKGVIEPFRLEHGTKLVSRMERRHVMAILGKKADTPAAANNLRKRLGQLFDHAIALDWIKFNPARLTKAYKIAGEGFHTWDETEIAGYFEEHEPGTMAHIAVTLMLYTGAARVDAVKLGWASIKATADGSRLQYTRQKTQKSNGVPVSIPIHPDLWKVIRDLPKDRPFLATAYGRGRTAAGLGNKMREWCDAAGLDECSAHGLRKACARRLAEAGATPHEIMAITGHKTLAEVQRYTQAALREGLADSAMQKLLARPNREQTVVNLAQWFANNSSNHMKGQ